MHGWLWGYGVTGRDIEFGGFSHAVAEVCDFFVSHAVEILNGWLVKLKTW